MHVALIADIHGNLAALDAVLAVLASEGPDQIVCLGDVAATGPQPREVVQRLRALACPVVMGNADAELLEPPAADSAPNDDMRRFLEISRWAAARLDGEDRAYIASFRPVVEMALTGGSTLLCCHGSPRSYDDVITATTPDDELDELLAGHDAALVAGGHTHARLLRGRHGREFVNPGSVGLAYETHPDGAVRVSPWAEFAIVSATDDNAIDVDFRRVPYDREATVRAMFEVKMPHASWWADHWR